MSDKRYLLSLTKECWIQCSTVRKKVLSSIKRVFLYGLMNDTGCFGIQSPDTRRKGEEEEGVDRLEYKVLKSETTSVYPEEL